MEQKKKGNRGMLFNVITFIVAFGLAFFVTTKLMSGNGVKSEIKKGIEAFNKECPKQIDAVTMLDSVALKPEKTVIYYSTLSADVNLAETNIDQVKKTTREAAQKNFDTSPAMKLFRENGYSLKYNYKNADKKDIFDFTIQTTKK